MTQSCRSPAPVELTDARKHGMRGKLQRSAVNTEVAYWKVYNFWYTHGAELQSENGFGTYNSDLVQKMFQLHPDIVTVMDKIIIEQQSNSVSLDTLQRKIEDILNLQMRHIIQFEFCLDEFNRYLAELRLLQGVLQHRGWF